MKDIKDINKTIPQIVTSPEFSKAKNIEHGFFTRKGGVSEGIYSSLNLGAGSHDKIDNVKKNRQIAMDFFGFEEKNLHSLYQVHSNKVITVSGQFEKRIEADAMVSKTANIILGILTADCTPVLFADNKNKIIGAAHAGWKGAITGILQNTIIAMEQLGAQKQNIMAVIGPTISQSSYEVGKEFYDRFAQESDENSKFFKPSVRAEYFQFDLPAYVAFQLQLSGIKSVTDVKMDTYSDEENFFSYRRSCHKNEPDYGRNLSVIAIKG